MNGATFPSEVAQRLNKKQKQGTKEKTRMASGTPVLRNQAVRPRLKWVRMAAVAALVFSLYTSTDLRSSYASVCSEKKITS